MKLPTKILEKKILSNGYRYVIAVDEVGMGCLAGPVVVCVVLFNKGFFKKRHDELKGVRDSKLLSASQREELARELVKTPNFRFQITYSYPKTIDQLNIYQAARTTMARAIKKLVNSNWQMGNSELLVTNYQLQKTIVLVDGRSKIDGLDIEQLAIVKGDRKVFAIACASIVAKVYRDKMMTKYAKRYPQYAFEKHKGYGTKLHQARLVQFGPSPIHRRSFAPVAKYIHPAGL